MLPMLPVVPGLEPGSEFRVAQLRFRLLGSYLAWFLWVASSGAAALGIALLSWLAWIAQTCLGRHDQAANLGRIAPGL